MDVQGYKSLVVLKAFDSLNIKVLESIGLKIVGDENRQHVETTLDVHNGVTS